MEDVVTYTKQLRGWSLFVWCVLWPQKWWVRGYERGWTAALKLVEGQKNREEGVEPPQHTAPGISISYERETSNMNGVNNEARNTLLNNFLEEYKTKFKSTITNAGGAAPILDTLGGLFDIVLGNNSMPSEKDYWRYSARKNFLNMLYNRTLNQSLFWYFLNDVTIFRISKLLDSFNLIEPKEVDFILFYNFSYIFDPTPYAYIALALRKG